MLSPVQAAVYELRNGQLSIKPGTHNQLETNITIDDLINTLLMYQTKLRDLEKQLVARDRKVLQLQEELKATKREFTLLKNHYFRQF